MQCQGVTLVPIYRHPTEKFVKRDTYTHAGAEQECKTHNLTLAKEAQPTHRITQCLTRFGQKVLSTTNVQEQLIWLGDCSAHKCNVMWSGHVHRGYMVTHVQIWHIPYKNDNRGSTLALCEKGKTQLIICA